MTILLVELIPKGRFKRIPDSQTLIGAFTWSWIRLFDTPDPFDIVQKMTFSSAFPKIGDIYYFPLPFDDKLLLTSEDEADIRKSIGKNDFTRRKAIAQIVKAKMIKKRRFLSAEAFSKLLKDKREEIQSSEFLNADFSGHLADVVEIHAQIDRLTNSTTPGGEVFYDTHYQPIEDFGLFFMLKVPEDVFNEHRQRIEDSLKMMGVFGIGPDRSVGYGQFDVEVKEPPGWDWLVPPDNTPVRFVLLSKMLSPEGIELDGTIAKAMQNGESFYRTSHALLMHESGVVDREPPIKGMAIWFTEGSTFKVEQAKEFYGEHFVNQNEPKFIVHGRGFPAFFSPKKESKP